MADQQPAQDFITLDPADYRATRYRVQITLDLGEKLCQQRYNDMLCQKKTQRPCCICGTPTCGFHEHEPSSYPCVIHRDHPRIVTKLCCVCHVCGALPRELQEQVYHFRRQVNGEEQKDE